MIECSIQFDTISLRCSIVSIEGSHVKVEIRDMFHVYSSRCELHFLQLHINKTDFALS